MKREIIQKSNSLVNSPGAGLAHLTPDQIKKLTDCFLSWYDEAGSEKKRRIRGRHWLIFLILLFTGCRLGEVIGTEDKKNKGLDDIQDVDTRAGEIKILTLKRKKNPIRIVPVPLNVTSEIATYWGHFPEMKGRIFSMTAGNFRRVFYNRAKVAGIPKDLAHPHILRHTRAFELLRAGVPVSIVQDLLGHSSLNTTAIYLRASGQEAKNILKDKGLI